MDCPLCHARGTAGHQARDDSDAVGRNGRRHTSHGESMSSLVVAGSRRVELSLLVGFIDLTGFALQSTRVADDDLAGVIDGYYQLVAERVSAAAGRVVK